VVRAIKAAQRLGFTLSEIQELLSSSRRGRAHKDDLHRRAHSKMMEVERRIAELEQIRHSLQAALTANCDSLTECSCGWTSTS
jgi:DNA-binding transcriptional MerR regulator